MCEIELYFKTILQHCWAHNIVRVNSFGVVCTLPCCQQLWFHTTYQDAFHLFLLYNSHLIFPLGGAWHAAWISRGLVSFQCWGLAFLSSQKQTCSIPRLTAVERGFSLDLCRKPEAVYWQRWLHIQACALLPLHFQALLLQLCRAELALWASPGVAANAFASGKMCFSSKSDAQQHPEMWGSFLYGFLR